MITELGVWFWNELENSGFGWAERFSGVELVDEERVSPHGWFLAVVMLCFVVLD
jgi:hypothetical protein